MNLYLRSTSSLIALALVACDPDGSSGATDKGGVIQDTGGADDNVLPTAPVISLDPSAPYTTDDLVVSVTEDAVDADGDTVSYGYAWTVDGAVASDQTGSTVPSSATTKGEVWSVTVTPSDAAGSGDAATAEVTIANTPPETLSATAGPDPAGAGDTLTCASGGTADVDGDVVTESFAWLVNGSEVATGEALAPGTFASGDAVVCVITPNDGEVDGEPVSSNTLVIDITAPIGVSVEILPDPPTTADDLVATASGDDADGDGLTWAYAWYINGTASATVTDTLPFTETARGDEIYVVATPSDGTEEGTSATSATVTVANTAPVATAVVLAPTSVYTDDTLTAAPTGEDPDEDTLAWTYLWYVDGTEVVGVTGDTLDGVLYFDRGQSVYVVATPTDGSARGTSVASAATTILNTVPTAPAVSLTPDPATTTDTLSVSASGSTDPDGADTVTYSYAWYEDANPSSIAVGTTLAPSNTQKGSVYRVVATPSDGTGLGPSTYAEVTIDNTAPVLSGPTLSASTVQVGDILTCTAGATDVDPVDAPTVTYAWSDGSTGATYTVTSSDAPGGSITCTATADDGDGGTDSASVSATVANTDPVLSGIGVTPSTGRVGDVLTCSATATDADAGTPTITYSWTGGATGATYTILDTDDPGDVLTCTATAADTDGGTASDAASAVVENTAPVMGTVSISPASASNDDTLTCTAAASDADGGVPAITYAWSGSIGGTLGTGATIDLSATAAESGETVSCTATADDGDGGTDVGAAALTITNRAPAVSLRLTPASGAVTSDTLTCSASASDDDGDSLSTTFVWTVGSSVVPASSTASLSSTLAGAFVAGDAVECTATTTDGKGGSDTDAVSTTIINTAPTVGTPSLSPATVYTNDTLSVSASVSDAEGDSVTVTYDWYVDGSSVQSGAASTLSGALYFGRDQTVYVIVTADDGTDTTSVTSRTITIANTPPSAPVATIYPAPAYEDDDLICEVDTASTDADGDAISYSFSWTVDGASTSATTTTVWPDDTVLAAETTGGEEWICTATPDDGSASGATATDTTTIQTWAGERIFTPCGVSGRTGPSQADCDAEYAGGTLDGEVTVATGIQTWTVPSSGDYLITAYGAQGASGDSSYVGGWGALSEGVLALTAGDVLYIAVGQEGVGQSSGSNGGGGGGSFVVDAAGTPLVVAGGGGGTRTSVNQDGCDAVASNYGVQGSGSSPSSSCSVKTSEYGLGGVISGNSWGSGGAGFYGDGRSERVSYSWGGDGGYSWANGIEGGQGNASCGVSGDGGFGGGGSGDGCWGGGGGGGFSGGDGGRVAGGGGSYVESTATDIVRANGYNDGEGWVVIDVAD